MSPKPAPTALSQRIREARAACGMTQQELARAAGVSSGILISRWECDAVEPSLRTLAKVASALGVRLDWLVTGVGQGPSGPTPTTEAA